VKYTRFFNRGLVDTSSLREDTIYMRGSYKEAIKKELTEGDVQGLSTEQIKEKALLLGATVQEFDQAESEYTNGKKDKKLKKLLTLDLTVHLVLLLIISVLAITFYSTMETKNILLNSALPLIKNKETVTLVQPVYAKAVEIAQEDIFDSEPSPITLTFSGKPTKEIYGFLPYWMIENHSIIPIESITTLSLFGIDVGHKGDILTTGPEGERNNGWEMYNSNAFENVITRAKDKNVHTELTFKAFSNTTIDSLTQDDQAQAVFIANALHLIQSKSIDGINLDFEYYGLPPQTVREGFTRLVRNLRLEMLKEIPHGKLTLSTYINEAAVSGLVDITAVQDSVDSFVVMGYDFHTPSGSPGPIAPLDGQLSLTGLIQSYLEKIPSEKIILAVGYYGYDWDLNGNSRSDHKVYPYAKVLQLSKDHALNWNETSQTPSFRYKDTENSTEREVHFENVRSLGQKYDFILKKNLKGVGIWALGYDGEHKELYSLLQQKFTQ